MRFLFWFLLACLLIGVPALLYASLQELPLLEEVGPPTPEDAVSTRDLARRLRSVTEASVDAPADPVLEVPLDKLNGALRFAARAIPGLRADAWIENGLLRVQASAPMPLLPNLGWINVEAVIPSFDGGIRLHSLRVGKLDLEPAFALRLVAWTMNMRFGSQAGDRLLASVPKLDVDADLVTLTLAMNGNERRSLTRAALGSLRGAKMPDAALIEAQYLALREAIDAGQLQQEGSIVPYLRFVLTQSLEQAGGEAEALSSQFTAGILALNQACGARDFRLLISRLIEELRPDARTWKAGCGGVTLAGRNDSKLHFITSAAIKAISTRDVSLSVGEFKELIDSDEAGGYDFTDIVADNAGTRLAERMMAAPPAAWPELIARIVQESDVIPSYEEIPGRLKRPDFEARFGQVDSSAYRTQVAEIEARIDALTLHAEPP